VVTGYHAWPTRVCRCLRACSYDSTATRPRPRSHETARPDIRPVPRAHHTRTPPCLVSSTCMSLPSVPACHIYLPVRRFLHHRTLHPTLQSAQDPPTAAVPILYFHCRSCPLKLLHFRPAITYRHSASPLGTTHVVLERQNHAVPSTYELLDYSP
jgi:hypothetical protein